MIKNTWCIYFSPSGTTKKIVNQIAAGIQKEWRECDLLAQREPMPELGPDDLLIAGAPVFAGRIPSPCAERLRGVRGDKTPAIIAAVYGNRDYDDALLELQELLEGQGFRVIAAAAAIAQHSIFPDVAAGRPDEEDLRQLQNFAGKCAKLLESLPQPGRPSVKGHAPYRAPAPVPLKPSADRSCTRCGACAIICPTGAIDPRYPQETDKERCISCTACIAACPQHARAFRGPAYKIAKAGFVKKFSARKEPEFFLL